MLHDVGQVVSYRSHHKHSYQLILHAERLRFGSRERMLVAVVSRYHRKTGPSLKHEEFSRLSSEDRGVVRRMAGLLRVADGLDRGHAAVVDQLTTRLTRDQLSIKVAPRKLGADLSLETWGASRKADVLAKLLDRPVVIRSSQFWWRPRCCWPDAAVTGWFKPRTPARRPPRRHRATRRPVPPSPSLPSGRRCSVHSPSAPIGAEPNHSRIS